MANYNYAIEISVMLYHDGEWVRTFTYYNHGETPPYGGVKSDATTSPVVMTVAEFENNVRAIEAWKKHVVRVVSSTKPIPDDGVPDTPVEYKVEIVSGELRYHLNMASIDMDVAYHLTNKTVTFATRSALDVSWRGFLFHQETMLDFLTQIKAQ